MHNFGEAKSLEYCMFSEANRFEYLTQGESRSDRGEAADSRREPAQIGAAVEDCPAYAAAVLACSLLFSLYAFPLPATPQPFQVFGPRSPPGRLLGVWAGGRTFPPP